MRPIEDLRSIHIVGVGGSATSGLARLLQARGLEVSGSDWANGDQLASLRRAGVRAESRHRPSNLGPTVDLVVHSAAIPPENLELIEARRRGIPIVKFARFLGGMVSSRNGIAVAGTHGKTSTAGMLASILVAAGRDPSFLIGGEHVDLGGNWRHGTGGDFILEACEYDRSFHCLRPRAGIVTTLERDHPEVYADESAVREAFEHFINGFLPGGILVVNGDRSITRTLPAPPAGRPITFGFGDRCDWRAVALRPSSEPSFDVIHGVRRWGRVTLSVPGRHNVANALAALALAAELDVPAPDIVRGLRSFHGVRRRFQVRGEPAGVMLVDDYAHHPTEVACALRTAREVFPGRRLWAIFQAHQLGRLAAFGNQFAAALEDCDRLVRLPAYSVREARDEFPADLETRFHASLRERSSDVISFASLDEAARELPGRLAPGDVCLLLGAGDVVRLTDALLERLGSGQEQA